jgi:hypothetical protein
MTDFIHFECGHVPELIVQSPTAMDLMHSMRHAPWIAVSTSEYDDGTLESIALVDECRMLFLQNNPYGIRRLLRDTNIKKISFGKEFVPGMDHVDLGEEISKVLHCEKPQTLRAAEDLLSLDTLNRVNEDFMCPQCRACIIFRVYTGLCNHN